MNARDEFFTNADGLRIAYRAWGRGGRTLVCVHGLLRNSHDFDVIAEALSDAYTVLCPDVMGRGASAFAPDASHYNLQYYVRDILQLLDLHGATETDYLGTSMGGMIGMVLASQPQSRIRRLVLNDIGPEITLAQLKDIAGRAETAPDSFSDMAEAEAYFRETYQEWGTLTDAQWSAITRHGVRDDNGVLRLHYDPRIMEGYQWPEGDVDLWPLYQTLKGPVLVLHGTESPVLTDAVADKLRQAPRTQVVDIPGVGHAPPLMSDSEIAPVRQFLLNP